MIFCAIWIFSGNGARGSLNGKSKKKRIFIIANIFFVISSFFYNRKIGFSNMYKVQGGLNVWRIEYPIHELLHSCKQHFTWWIDRFATSLITTTSVQQHTDIWNLLLNIATIYSLFSFIGHSKNIWTFFTITRYIQKYVILDHLIASYWLPGYWMMNFSLVSDLPIHFLLNFDFIFVWFFAEIYFFTCLELHILNELTLLYCCKI